MNRELTMSLALNNWAQVDLCGFKQVVYAV